MCIRFIKFWNSPQVHTINHYNCIMYIIIYSLTENEKDSMISRLPGAPVVDGDQDDIVHHPEVRPKPTGGPAPEHEGPAVEPDSHREGPGGVSSHGRNVNIEVETVLSTTSQQTIIVQPEVELRTDRVPLL